MNIVADLWWDERGFVLSAEAVLVGTVGVLGVVVGLNMLSRAVNEELQDFAFAIRSLDQSYSVDGFSSAGAWTAGSRFVQEDVAISLERLRGEPPAREAEPPAEPPVPPEAEPAGLVL